MANVFESLKDLISPQGPDSKKNPLHIAEVANFWLILTLLEEGLGVYQLGLNTTTDKDLIHAFKNGEEASRELIKQIKIFFRNEGIPLPPASEEKPKSDPNAIPLGVKYTDDELANLVSAKIAAEITLLGQAMAVCIRDDACQILFQIQYEIFKYGSSFKKLMGIRGWLKIPPYYYPPGRPEENK